MRGGLAADFSARPWWRREPESWGASERLTLRGLRLIDRQHYLESIDADVMRNNGWGRDVLDDQARAFALNTRLQFRASPANLVVADRRSGVLVGVYSFAAHPQAPVAATVSLGWWLAAWARGWGLGTESLALVLRHVHDELDLDDVQMGTKLTNTATLAQIARCGAEPVCDSIMRFDDGSAEMGRWFVHRRSSPRHVDR